MRKLIAFFLCFTTILVTVGCKKEKYPEIESTKEEARTMMSFSIDGETYELKYELYRALFLNYSSQYDGGDKSFWSKDTSADALNTVNEKIIERALDIFAMIHIAKSIGFDPYSKEAENLISEYIAKSVEGDGDTVIGFDGDYDAYLESLKAANLNYSVQKLLFRYSIAYDEVIAYYEGAENENNPTENVDSALEITRDNVLAFYNGSTCARVSPITINAEYFSYERALSIRNAIASASTTNEALRAAISNTTANETDILDGVIIGTNTLDKAYYSEVTDAAFALDANETSDVITVVTDSGTEYWILYKQEKSDEHFNKCYESIKSSYVSQKIGETIEQTKSALRNSLSESEAYKNLNHSDISMP